MGEFDKIQYDYSKIDYDYSKLDAWHVNVPEFTEDAYRRQMLEFKFDILYNGADPNDASKYPTIQHKKMKERAQNIIKLMNDHLTTEMTRKMLDYVLYETNINE